MIEQLKGIHKIYDLLVLCSSYILNECKNKPYEFALFNDDAFDSVYDAIDGYCCDVKLKGRRAAFDDLKNYIIDFMDSEVTVEKCFAVVRYIDELVEIEINGRLLGEQHIKLYSAMNEQYTNQVRIIPKMKDTIFERSDLHFRSENHSHYSLFRKRRECACSLLDKETVNYMIWDEDHIDKYPLSIYHLNEKNPITKHFFERENIVFGIVPFTNRPLKEILEIRYEKRTFYIEQMYKKAEEELKERYKDICQRCRTQDIDFLIFPEMLITEDMIASIHGKGKMISPQIIVNGSIWKDYVNLSIITDGSGNEIFRYTKKEPYIVENGDVKYREYLDQSKNKEYSILEIEGIGRIGIGICRDLISEEVKCFHRCIGTNILIVPAYTTSMDLQSSADGLSQEYNCIVIVANACSAMLGKNNESKEGRIGFISLPAKCKTDRTKIIQMYKKDECIKECNNRCMGKRICIDFYHTRQYEAGISYDVKETSF